MFHHAITKTQVQWVSDEFEKDLENAFRNIPSNLQFSAYAVGMALRKDGVHIETPVKDEKIVEQLCKIIQTGNLNEQELICSLLALGWICDQRTEPSSLTLDINRSLLLFKIIFCIRRKLL